MQFEIILGFLKMLPLEQIVDGLLQMIVKSTKNTIDDALYTEFRDKLMPIVQLLKSSDFSTKYKIAYISKLSCEIVATVSSEIMSKENVKK